MKQDVGLFEKYEYDKSALEQHIDLNALMEQQKALNKKFREMYTISGLENYPPIFSHIQKGE